MSSASSADGQRATSRAARITTSAINAKIALDEAMPPQNMTIPRIERPAAAIVTGRHHSVAPRNPPTPATNSTITADHRAVAMTRVAASPIAPVRAQDSPVCSAQLPRPMTGARNSRWPTPWANTTSAKPHRRRSGMVASLSRADKTPIGSSVDGPTRAQSRISRIRHDRHRPVGLCPTAPDRPTNGPARRIGAPVASEPWKPPS